MHPVTEKQIIIRFQHPDAAGRIDLSHCDLRGINMQDPKIKDLFDQIAKEILDSKGQTNKFIDMTGSNISGLDFRDYNLSHVIMSNVDASKAIFIRSIMSDTKLDFANLDYADFRLADLYHAKIFEASIYGTNFSGAKLSHTHGLGKPVDEAVKRLGVVGTIRDAKLPAVLEEIRNIIQNEIIKHRGNNPPPPHSTALLQQTEW